MQDWKMMDQIGFSPGPVVFPSLLSGRHFQSWNFRRRGWSPPYMFPLLMRRCWQVPRGHQRKTVTGRRRRPFTILISLTTKVPRLSVSLHLFSLSLSLFLSLSPCVCICVCVRFSERSWRGHYDGHDAWPAAALIPRITKRFVICLTLQNSVITVLAVS